MTVGELKRLLAQLDDSVEIEGFDAFVVNKWSAPTLLRSPYGAHAVIAPEPHVDILKSEYGYREIKEAA